MTTATAEPRPTTQPETWQPTRRLFSVDEYMAMAEAGVLSERDHVELIDGEIIVMAPIGVEHEANVDDGTHILVRAFDNRAIVRIQGSVTLDDRNRPQPDLMLLRLRDGGYRSSPPGPDDVLLLIEVSDSSLAYDRGVKLALYARFGVPEVWIENVPDRVIEAHTDPVDGEYTVSRTYSPGETITPTAFPDISLPVSEIIGAVSGGDAPGGE